MDFRPVQPNAKPSPIQSNSFNPNQIPLGSDIIINEMIVLFDGSPFLYIHGANSFYERSLRSHIEGTLLNNRTHKYIGIIDGKGNYRKDVATAKVYKGNRATMKKTLHETFPYLKDVKKTLMEDYGFIVVNGIEADDAVGILAKRLNKYPYITLMKPTEDTAHAANEGCQYKLERIECSSYNCVIASIDKDLLQLYCFHYDIKKHTLVRSTHANSFVQLNAKRTKIIGTGYKFLYAQILTGDPVDNIPGLHKTGSVGALRILEGCETEKECEAAVRKAFVAKEKELANKAVEKGEIDEMPDIELLYTEAYRKYNENRNLIFILRKQRNLGSIKINTYPTALFEPVNSF